MSSRSRGTVWDCPTSPSANGGQSWQPEHVTHQILMDIRDELAAIRRVLECSNTQAIPRTLRAIARSVAKPKRKPKPQPAAAPLRAVSRI